MGKVEAVIKSEIVRLARRELRKIAVPLGRDVRSLKSTISQLRKTVSALERFTALQRKEMGGKKPLEATPEEVKISRFSPRLIRSLRKKLRISQKELAILTGVTVGAIHQWESGMFKPSPKKKIVLVALRKLGRRDARKLLEESAAEWVEKKIRKPRKKGKPRAPRK
jgi:DNA-binding transcriptional regulator YiaG